MLRKKGRYILILLLIIFIWSYTHNKDKVKKQLINNIHTLIDSIRVQDYFKISTLLDDNSSRNISVDDIKNFTQNFKIDRDFNVKIKNYDDNKVEGNFGNKIEEHNFTIILKEQNNTMKYTNIKIDNKELKANSPTFPIISEQANQQTTQSMQSK